MACVANAKQFGFILGLVAAAAASEIFGHGQISLKMEEGNPHRGFQVRPHQEMKREEEATSITATDAEDASVLEEEDYSPAINCNLIGLTSFNQKTHCEQYLEVYDFLKSTKQSWPSG